MAIAILVFIQRYSGVSIPALPPSQPVQDLRERDSEDPGFQRRFAFKAVDVAKNLQEDFLNDVRGISGIPKHPIGHMENRSMVDANEFVVGRVIVRPQALYE